MATIGIYLEKEVHEYLEAESKRTNISVSKLINNAIRERVSPPQEVKDTKLPEKQTKPVRKAGKLPYTPEDTRSYLKVNVEKGEKYFDETDGLWKRKK